MDDLVRRIIAYRTYIDFIERKFLNRYFEAQKPYLKCKEGCAHCCIKGEYPVYEIEFENVKIGFNSLDYDKKVIVSDNIKKIIKDKNNHDKEQGRFLYTCPFLINNSCSIYKFRPLICRTFGLMFFIEKDGKRKTKIPYCVHYGLNYAQVYDEEKETISREMWEKSGIKEEPLAYNVGLEAITKKENTEPLNFEFGKAKSMIEWFM